MSNVTLEAHGRPIAPMVLGRAGSQDRLYHTLKHFLDLHQDWSTLSAGSAPTPRSALDGLRASGIRTGALKDQLTDTRWWEEPRRAHLARAHDEGYYPRYVLLAQRAGPFGDRSSKWHHSGGRRLQAEVGRFVIVGELEPERFQAISAYSSWVIRESREAGAGLNSLAQALSGLIERGLLSVPERALQGVTP